MNRIVNHKRPKTHNLTCLNKLINKTHLHFPSLGDSFLDHLMLFGGLVHQNAAFVLRRQLSFERLHVSPGPAAKIARLAGTYERSAVSYDNLHPCAGWAHRSEKKCRLSIWVPICAHGT